MAGTLPLYIPRTATLLEKMSDGVTNVVAAASRWFTMSATGTWLPLWSRGLLLLGEFPNQALHLHHPGPRREISSTVTETKGRHRRALEVQHSPPPRMADHPLPLTPQNDPYLGHPQLVRLSVQLLPQRSRSPLVWPHLR